MTTLHAGDFDYDIHGHGYAQRRRPDPRIAARIQAALGDARTVVNVGAGAGSYEPADRYVVAVEPSAGMRAAAGHRGTCAERDRREPTVRRRRLRRRDGDRDRAQWRDVARGLAELRRVARGPVAVLTFDGDELDRHWLPAYAPELIAAERRRYPPVPAITAAVGRTAEVIEVPIPIDCVDRFTEAYYARPEAFLDQRVRAAQSAWGFVSPEATEQSVERLRADLASGAWEQRYGHLRTQRSFSAPCASWWAGRDALTRDDRRSRRKVPMINNPCENVQVITDS